MAGATKKAGAETPSAAAAAAATAAIAMSIDGLIAILDEDGERVERGGLQVIGPRKGRRRVGRAFGPEPVIIPLVSLGEDELRAIDGDPELRWAVVQLPEDGQED